MLQNVAGWQGGSVCVEVLLRSSNWSTLLLARTQVKASGGYEHLPRAAVVSTNEQTLLLLIL